MPRQVVTRPRALIAADTLIEPSQSRADWVLLDADDTHVRISMARVDNYDPVTKAYTDPLVVGRETNDRTADIHAIRLALWISFDNGATWNRVGTLTTGPGVHRRSSDDPDIPEVDLPILTHTRGRWEIKPQQGAVPRLIRWELETSLPLNTEITIDSDNRPRASQLIAVG